MTSSNKTSLAAIMRGEPHKPIPSTRPSSWRDKLTLIHWPAVAAAAIPCLLFVGVVMFVLAQGYVDRANAQAMRRLVQTQVEETPSLPRSYDMEAMAPALPEEVPTPKAPVAKANPFLPRAPAPMNVVAEQEAPAEEDSASDEPAARPAGCQRFGTAVDFAVNHSDAFKRAGQEQKLLFILHISGNFEEAKFT